MPPTIKNPDAVAARPLRLHVGCGDVRIQGWANIDLQDLPEVDVVADVTQGLPFEGVEAVFAEHFIEHLELGAAVDFLLETHRVLAPGAWLRLTTPNLDWVFLTHYEWNGDAAARYASALRLNRAFYGWQHRFIWNRETLEEALSACGFDQVRWCHRGESELPFFRGIEHHVTYDDNPGLPHILIAEARKGPPRPEALRSFRQVIENDFRRHISDKVTQESPPPPRKRWRWF